MLLALLGFGPAMVRAATLTWTDTSTDETGFHIERSTGPSDAAGTAFLRIASVGGNVTTFTDSTALPGVAYLYRVSAYNEVGQSGYSNTVSTAGQNAPPTISVLLNQVVLLGRAPPAQPFTVADAETAPANLVVTGLSSNPTLIPPSGIIFGGSGGSRTVTIDPRPGKTGVSTVTVLVSDGLATASRSFLVTVTQFYFAMGVESPLVAEATPAVGTDADEPDSLAMTLTQIDATAPASVDFVVSGEQSRQVLVRAVGPTLELFGVSNAADNPHIQIVDGQGGVVHAVGAWGGASELAATFARAGIFPLPLESADAAAIVTLPAGAYQLRASAGGGRGAVLLQAVDVGSAASRNIVANTSAR